MQVAIVKSAQNDALYCGDECACWQMPGTITLCVVDGLGHGKQAEKAANAAVNYLAHHLSEPLPDIFAGCNVALRNTRGVAMGIAIIDQDSEKLTYAGIGNTRAMVVGEKTIRLSSNFGIVGAGYKTLNSETVRITTGNLVILYTDGLEEMVDITGYDEVLHANVQRLAEKLIEDWRILTDDAAVLIYKYESYKT